MSFGFGFALPAYPLRGGGGNNPFNQLGPTLDLSFAGVVTDQSDPNGYTLNTNFIIPQYQIAAQYVVWETGVGLVDKTFSQIITFTRASTATFFNSAGVLTSAAIDAPRFDYNPSTLAAQGLLIEESRTNSIRNNTMVGAVAGTPGTLPTNWPAITLSGLSRQIVGTGTESGITYMDVRIFGTTTSALFAVITPESTNVIAATPNSIWSHSWYVKLAGGSTTGVSAVKLVLTNYDASNVALNQFLVTNITPTAAALNTQRFTQTSLSTTFSDATTAFIRPILQVEAPISTAIDITLRIGLPQLELGAFATSVIPTTTTALTRAADVASVNTLSPWYNASAGTIYVEAQKIANETATTFPRLVCFDDGTLLNTIQIVWNTGVSRLYGNIQSAGVTQADLGANGTTQTNVNKIAFGVAANDFAASVNGAAVSTDLSGTVPTITAMGIGATTNSTSRVSAWIRRITYYPRRLSNAELVSITS
jgi:hypothetical protein